MAIFQRRSRRPAAAGMFLAPLLIGLAYGLARHLPQDPSFGFLYWQSPFFFSVLAGIAIAFTCRPVLSRISWSRPTAMGLAFALLAGIGPLGDWCAAWLLEGLHLAAFPLNLPESGLAILLGALAAAALMTILFRSAGGTIGAKELWARVRLRPMADRLARLGLLALLAVAFWLAAAWVEARIEEASEGFYLPLVEPNPWLRLEGLWMGGGESEGAGAIIVYLLILWARGLAMFAPLVPLALTLRGSRAQLTLVFGILLFVVGDFAPLMLEQPYPSLSWLLSRTALGLGRAAILGGLTMALFGISTRREAGEGTA